MKMRKILLNVKYIIYIRRKMDCSIVEMILVVSIIAIVATVISLLYMSSVRSQRDLLNKSVSVANLRTTIYSISKDIKEAKIF